MKNREPQDHPEPSRLAEALYKIMPGWILKLLQKISGRYIVKCEGKFSTWYVFSRKYPL